MKQPFSGSFSSAEWLINLNFFVKNTFAGVLPRHYKKSQIVAGRMNGVFALIKCKE